MNNTASKGLLDIITPGDTLLPFRSSRHSASPIGAIAWRSTETTLGEDSAVAFARILSARTCDHDPGAAQRSTALVQEERRWNSESI